MFKSNTLSHTHMQARKRNSLSYSLLLGSVAALLKVTSGLCCEVSIRPWVTWLLPRTLVRRFLCITWGRLAGSVIPVGISEIIVPGTGKLPGGSIGGSKGSIMMLMFVGVVVAVVGVVVVVVVVGVVAVVVVVVAAVVITSLTGRSICRNKADSLK